MGIKNSLAKNNVLKNTFKAVFTRQREIPRSRSYTTDAYFAALFNTAKIVLQHAIKRTKAQSRIILSILLLCLISACGGGESTSTQSPSDDNTQQTSIYSGTLQNLDIHDASALSVTTVFSNSNVDTDGRFTITLPPIHGRTLLSVEREGEVVLMKTLIAGDLSTGDNTIGPESTAISLAILSNAIHIGTREDFDFFVTAIKKLDAFKALVTHIETSINQDTWSITGTNAVLKEHITQLLGEIITASETGTFYNPDTAPDQYLSRSISSLKDPQELSKVGAALKTVSPAYHFPKFSYRMANGGMRFVSIVTKKRKSTEEIGLDPFEATGNVLTVPSPSVSLLDYAYFVLSEKPTPSITWPPAGYDPFSLDVHDTKAIKLVVLGPGISGVNAVTADEHEALAKAFIVSTFFDVFAPLFDISDKKFTTDLTAQLMLPKNAFPRLIEDAVKVFMKQQAEKGASNWFFDLKNGNTNHVFKDAATAMLGAINNNPDLVISLYAAYTTDKALLNSLKINRILKRANNLLTLFDMGQSIYNLMHTVIDYTSLPVRAEFNYSTECDAPNSEDTQCLAAEELEASHVLNGRCYDSAGCDGSNNNKTRSHIAWLDQEGIDFKTGIRGKSELFIKPTLKRCEIPYILAPGGDSITGERRDALCIKNLSFLHKLNDIPASYLKEGDAFIPVYRTSTNESPLSAMLNFTCRNGGYYPPDSDKTYRVEWTFDMQIRDYSYETGKYEPVHHYTPIDFAYDCIYKDAEPNSRLYGQGPLKMRTLDYQKEVTVWNTFSGLYQGVEGTIGWSGETDGTIYVNVHWHNGHPLGGSVQKHISYPFSTGTVAHELKTGGPFLICPTIGVTYPENRTYSGTISISNGDQTTVSVPFSYTCKYRNWSE